MECSLSIPLEKIQFQIQDRKKSLEIERICLMKISVKKKIDTLKYIIGERKKTT